MVPNLTITELEQDKYQFDLNNETEGPISSGDIEFLSLKTLIEVGEFSKVLRVFETGCNPDLPHCTQKFYIVCVNDIIHRVTVVDRNTAVLDVDWAIRPRFTDLDKLEESIKMVDTLIIS